jgi:hypothetical protein
VGVKRICKILYKIEKMILFALSPLELGLFSELVVFVLAHFLLAPLLNVSHSSTSLSKQ